MDSRMKKIWQSWLSEAERLLGKTPAKKKKPKKKSSNKHVLTDKAVRTIRRSAKNGTSKSELAKIFKVSYITIYKVCNQQTYKHIGG